MPNVKFRYNPDRCAYEPIHPTVGGWLKKVGVFITLSCILSVGLYVYYQFNFAPLDEILLKKELEKQQLEWAIIKGVYHQFNNSLSVYIHKDDQIYRTLLDTYPLSPDVRKAGHGGREIDAQDLSPYGELPLYKDILSLRHRAEIENQSYDELLQLYNVRSGQWSSYPAIQPIHDGQLNRLHLTYGRRYHPIFQVIMEHKGLDFSAPKGTPVYATGNGRVNMAYFSGSYGNVVYINHGNDFETRYAHLSKFTVSPGDIIVRGQLIGYVGNTGNSVSSHLHYEVLFRGRNMNPIHFFQQDLSVEAYEHVIDTPVGQ